ncbi:traK [Duganella sp. FT92W]|uniref:TraK n=1 Tax=Pseudoduganella rivuli TaxID=2666085 RepID=A0A7X2IQ86_9BURK|nr:TraK family protein [Pseudoduganella rivuli]MRV74065.1 traK [Pseudoduganella rivuli]
MNKRFTDQIGEWIKQHEECRRDGNLVAFLAVRNDVGAAIRAGYTVKIIWKYMRASQRIDFRHDTFRRYVHRLIRDTDQFGQHGAEDKATPQPPQQLGQHTPRSLPEKSTGFFFNPIPNKDELL